MKKLIILLLLLSASIAGYSQSGFSGVFLRVQDSAAYVNSSNTIAKHAAGYADIWYSDASNLFWKWNGSSYEAFGASSIDGKPAMTSYASSQTLTLADYNSFNNQGITRWTISGPANLTVPLDATADFNDGAQIGIDNQGSDTLTVVWTGGVTGNDGGYVEIFPGGSALLVKVATNEWDLLGTQPGGGGSGDLTTTNFVFNEVPSGTVNGSNTAFTIANTPTSGTLSVYRNGLRMKNIVDYTFSGTTLTFVVAPETGDELLTDYMK